MPITAAQIESNGWVLRLTVTGALTQPNTNFGAYNFDYDGVPRLTLAAAHPGFVKSAGAAVAGSMARTIVGLRPLRQVVNPASPTVKVLDEIDLGGGQVQVRLALSQSVHATETTLLLSTLAGWRSGEAAQTGLSVTNDSSLAAPVPIMRWVLPPFEQTQGPFRVSLIVGSHHPVGFDPVAGVRFIVSDGVTTRTFWDTTLETDNSYGDNLRCHTLVIDPAQAPAFTAGVLRVDAEVYPYLGAMRTTDPAGTRSMTNLRAQTVSLLTVAEAPWVIGYDPDGSRYGNFSFVDPVNGTTTPVTAMVQPTLAAAKAIAPAARPRDVATAVQAMRLRARTLPTANGQPATSANSVDGLRVVLAAGVHNGLGATAVSTTTTTAEMPVTIEGDPDDANARNTVILDAETARNLRISRVRFRRMTIRMGSSQALHSNSIGFLWLDNVELVGKAGQEAANASPFQMATGTPTTQWAWCITNCRIWKTGTTLGASTRQIQLFRANQHTRQARATIIVKNRVIPPAEDGFTNYSSTFNQVGYANPQQTINLGHFEDWVVAYNDARSIRWIGLTRSPIPAALAGTPKDLVRRHLILNNVFERVTGTFTPGQDTSTSQGGYGENEHVIMRDIIVEGNTFAGAGFNAFYNDPVPLTLADCDTQNNEAYNIRNANNAYDRQASKQDEFNDDDTRNVRRANGFPTAEGHRPQLTGAWSTHFGTDVEGVVDASRAESGPGNFLKDGLGLRSVQFQPALASVGWANDACEKGSDQGLGDYTPTAGSPLLGRIVRANSDRDWLGNARQVNGAAGALEAVGAAVQPQGARHGHVATVPGLAAASVLTAQDARHTHSAAAPLLSTGVALMAAAAAHQHRASAPQAGWATSLFAANALMTSAAMAAVVAWQGGLAVAGGSMGFGSTAPPVNAMPPLAAVLASAGARHAVLTAAAPVFLEGSVPEDRTLKVRADARTIFVTETKQEN